MADHEQFEWIVTIIGCLTLGLAPFNPPHIYQKLVLLKRGQLKRLIDWFDLLYHSLPWGYLIFKVIHFIWHRSNHLFWIKFH
ncbi:MAG: RND transporter [Methylotenera sp.]|nr:RND transporter [Oligoflexia bacterium]